MWAGQRVYGVRRPCVLVSRAGRLLACVCARKAKDWRMAAEKLEEQERAVQELHSMKSTGCASKEGEGRDQGIKKSVCQTPQYSQLSTDLQENVGRQRGRKKPAAEVQ